MLAETISFADFSMIELRAGTIVRAEPFPAARKPAYKLFIDFGELGTRQSSAQITALYKIEELAGLQVICVLNFKPKNIAGFTSEVLVCGFEQSAGVVVLARPERQVPNGAKLF